jgi:DNA repair photolyase
MSFLLRPADLPDNFTRSLYKIAPYRGCAHGCRYCDGRAERYYVEGDFERDIVTRETIPNGLLEDLPKVRESGMVAFGSGTTDPYQPCEARLGITGACAQTLADNCIYKQSEGRPPVSLPSGRQFTFDVSETAEADFLPRLSALAMTKSLLALRDIEYWGHVNEQAGFVLLVSLTSLDEGLREIMEPGASAFSERIELLRAYKSAGCTVGILAMPLLPGLSDSLESIQKLYAAAKEIGVDFVMPGGLTLRPGRQKELFLMTLRKAYPELLATVDAIYFENRDSGAPTRAAQEALTKKLTPIRRESGLPWLLPYGVFRRMLPPHDAIRVLFRDMLELYAEQKVSTAELRRSADRYDAWLVEQRRFFRRHRKTSSAWLQNRLPRALASGELTSILDNSKLSRFVHTIVAEGASFNYTTLRLETPPT